METHAKETVIIVHGTWAAPKPDQLSWYQIPEKPEHEPSFVTKLNAALEKRGSLARCWAHCKDNSEIFNWSGENAWIDRTRAASKLAAYINDLQADGWRCHVVAHSHGGNVVAEALPQLRVLSQITRSRDHHSTANGTVTTLGTPFMDVMSPIEQRIARQRRIQKTSLTFIAIIFLIMVVVGAEDLRQAIFYFTFCSIIILALLLNYNP